MVAEITVDDLPIYPERIYERAQELEPLLKAHPHFRSGTEWDDAIILACREVDIVMKMRH